MINKSNTKRDKELEHTTQILKHVIKRQVEKLDLTLSELTLIYLLITAIHDEKGSVIEIRHEDCERKILQ